MPDTPNSDQPPPEITGEDTPAEPGGDQVEAVSDASTGNWVDQWAPVSWRPYLRLARFDRPIGAWLLFWPCLWGHALALPSTKSSFGELILFGSLYLVGSFIMRGAGCTFNDIVDARIDAEVERTRSRPIPSGAVSKTQAWIFLFALCGIGLLVLVQFNRFAILVALASLIMVAAYPFMKRITYWPQAWLGLTLNWGALFGWSAVQESLSWPPAILFFGAMFWTLGYDTIYAHQDKEDDALIGVKSTALLLGDKTKAWLYGFYFTFWGILLVAGFLAGLSGPFFLTLPFVAIHLNRQIMNVNINDAKSCLEVFRSNRDFGAIVFLSIMLGNTFQ